MDPVLLNEEERLNEMFGKRYEYLLILHKNVKKTEWRRVIQEMRTTLKEYDYNSKELNIFLIKNKMELVPSSKRSVNCLAVASALFCSKFHDLEIEFDISDITNSLHQNIKSLLPYLSHDLVAVRIVEIMLYVMSTIREEFKDMNGQWSSLAADCFRHPSASDEIKLATAILICEFDDEKKYIQFEMYLFLQRTLSKAEYFGFIENDLRYGLAKVTKTFLKEIEEERLYVMFGHRYDHLLHLHKNVKETKGSSVIEELNKTLKEFEDKSKKTILCQIENKKELLPSNKRSVNCLAVAAALFCDKFHDWGIKGDIGYITASLRQNIKSLLPYLSHDIVAVRIVEIMLYAMSTTREDYKDVDGQWSSLAADCFRHPSASPEIKLAAAILICNVEVHKKYVTKEMFNYLNTIFIEGIFYGFKEEDVKNALSKVQSQFTTAFRIKELDEVPRDSGYGDEDTDESIAESKLCKMFGDRYDHLLHLHENVKETKESSVIEEMNQTLKEFEDKSKKTILYQIANKNELLPSGKKSVNCLAVASALFCSKFNDSEIEGEIGYITASLHQNINSLLPYLSHEIVVVRIVEIMLYAMCTTREDYKDVDEQWSSLAADCFRHPSASSEIKLAAAILICEFDENKHFIEEEMFIYLNDTLHKEVYLGFKKKDIKYSLLKVQERFPKGFNDKKDIRKRNDSDYASVSSIVEGRQRPTPIKHKDAMAMNDIDQERTHLTLSSKSTFSLVIVVLIIAIMVMWFLRR